MKTQSSSRLRDARTRDHAHEPCKRMRSEAAEELRDVRDALSALDASIFVCAVCQDALMDDYKCLPCEHRYCGGCHNRLSKRCSVCREPSDKTIPDVCGRAVLHLMLRASKCGTVKLPLSRLTAHEQDCFSCVKLALSELQVERAQLYKKVGELEARSLQPAYESGLAYRPVYSPASPAYNPASPAYSPASYSL